MGGAGRIVGSTIGALTGANAGARAAGQAAQAQEAVARQNLAFSQDTMKKAAEMAGAGPQELRAYEQSLASQEKNLQNETRLLDAIDPTLMEASSQALKLLRGESAGITQVTDQARGRQRAQLVDMLREQLGPGAETSSAGAQQLRNFDLESQQVTAQTQQGALGQLFSAQQSLLPSLSNARGMAAGRLADIGGRFGAINQRQSSAFLNGAGLVSNAYQGAQQAAGSQFVEAATRAQNQQQTFGSLLSAGGAALGGYLGGKADAKS